MKSFAPLAILAASVAAKTDLEGCTSFTSMVTVRTEIGYGNTFQSIVWYDPENLEICQGVDCGGGRAPPKTVPGCPAYSGTETVTPSFLSEDPLKPAATATTETSVSTEAPEATSTSAGDDDKEDKEEEETSAPPTSGASTPVASKTGSTPSASKSSAPDAGNDDKDGNEEGSDNESGEGSDSSEDSENPETTNSPDAAMPTGMSAMNVAAGLAAAAVALL
jgi:hypothetical protein